MIDIHVYSILCAFGSGFFFGYSAAAVLFALLVIILFLILRQTIFSPNAFIIFPRRNTVGRVRGKRKKGKKVDEALNYKVVGARWKIRWKKEINDPTKMLTIFAWVSDKVKAINSEN